MEKIFTLPTTLSEQKAKKVINDLPSQRVLDAILNYSKALKVQTTITGQIVYLAN